MWLAILIKQSAEMDPLYLYRFPGSRLKSPNLSVKLELPPCMRFYLKMFTDQENITLL